jgi:hypothetical protein
MTYVEFWMKCKRVSLISLVDAVSLYHSMDNAGLLDGKLTDEEINKVADSFIDEIMIRQMGQIR